MFEASRIPVTFKKYARLTERADLPFSVIDQRIKQHLQELEKQDSNLWTNPNYNKNEFVHSIFQYPAMMVPEVQRQIIDVIFRSSGSQNITKMLDPFMGSATSLVSSMHYGVDCYGQDINPLAILISKVRTSLINVNVRTLYKKTNQLIKSFYESQSTEINVHFKGRDKWFKSLVSIELSKIQAAIRQEDNIDIRRFYWANLAEVIRMCSNDRTSTFKLHARPLEEIDLRNLSPLVIMERQLKESIEAYHGQEYRRSFT